MQKNNENGNEAPLDLTMPRDRVEGEYVEYEDKSPKKEPEEITSPKKEPEEITSPMKEPGEIKLEPISPTPDQLPCLSVQGSVQQLPPGLDYGQILVLEDLDIQHALLADCGDLRPLADVSVHRLPLAETPDQLYDSECLDALPPSTQAIFNQIRAILGGPPLEGGVGVDYPVPEVLDEVSDQPPGSPSSDVLPPSIRDNFNRIRALLNQPLLEDGGAMEDDVVHLDEAGTDVGADRGIYNHVPGRGDNNNGVGRGDNNNWLDQGNIVEDGADLEVLDEVVVLEDPDDAEISIEDEILSVDNDHGHGEGDYYAGQGGDDVPPAVLGPSNRYAAPLLYCITGEGGDYLVEEPDVDHHDSPLARYGLTLDDLCSASELTLQAMGYSLDSEAFRQAFLQAANVLREDDDTFGRPGL